jgi:hypothetical protein
MSAGLRGGCKQAWFSTTSTFTASIQIGNIHNGSEYSTEAVTEEDGAGLNVSAGHRLTGTLRSTRVTASYLSTLIDHESDCTNVWIKMLDNSNAIHRIGPGRVSVTRNLGTPGTLSVVTIGLSGFSGLVSDLVTIS